MRIVHFAPFAPNACGLFEAARDMAIADMLAGHEVHIVDVGYTVNGTWKAGEIGKMDSRGGTYITSSDPQIALSADVLIAHTGVPDNWIVGCQAPIVWILHGRPAACFRPEQFGREKSYSLLAMVAKWPRVKKMVTFWPYHVKFWEPIDPHHKVVCFDAPPIDGARFCESGPRHNFGELGGNWNILIADSWREDVDIYELSQGIIDGAKRLKGVKFHFCSMEEPLGPWEYVLTQLRSLGALGGDVGKAQGNEMEKIATIWWKLVGHDTDLDEPTTVVEDYTGKAKIGDMGEQIIFQLHGTMPEKGDQRWVISANVGEGKPILDYGTKEFKTKREAQRDASAFTKERYPDESFKAAGLRLGPNDMAFVDMFKAQP